MQSKLFLPLVVLALLAGCATEPEIRDSAPDVDRAALMNIPDAVPRVEVVTRAGNRNPYTVFKKTYHLLPTSEGYRERGTASWYGTKFHGRNTANGEVYDMNAMTAAHKTLPIPCYVRVRNLHNQRSIIVRVNDRGPFHGDRLIDLSYAAAVKLGFADQGTVPVDIEVITPANSSNFAKRQASKAAVKPVVSVAEEQRVIRTAPVSTYTAAAKVSTPVAPAPAAQAPISDTSRPEVISDTAERQTSMAAAGRQWFLQAGAFLDEPTAQRLQQQLSYITQLPVVINAAAQNEETIYRVKIGPSQQQAPLLRLQQEMRAVDLGAPFMVSQSN